MAIVVETMCTDLSPRKIPEVGLLVELLSRHASDIGILYMRRTERDARAYALVDDAYTLFLVPSGSPAPLALQTIEEMNHMVTTAQETLGLNADAKEQSLPQVFVPLIAAALEETFEDVSERRILRRKGGQLAESPFWYQFWKMHVATPFAAFEIIDPELTTPGTRRNIFINFAIIPSIDVFHSLTKQGAETLSKASSIPTFALRR